MLSVAAVAHRFVSCHGMPEEPHPQAFADAPGDRAKSVVVAQSFGPELLRAPRGDDVEGANVAGVPLAWAAFGPDQPRPGDHADFARARFRNARGTTHGGDAFASVVGAKELHFHARVSAPRRESAFASKGRAHAAQHLVGGDRIGDDAPHESHVKALRGVPSAVERAVPARAEAEENERYGTEVLHALQPTMKFKIFAGT